MPLSVHWINFSNYTAVLFLKDHTHNKHFHHISLLWPLIQYYYFTVELMSETTRIKITKSRDRYSLVRVGGDKEITQHKSSEKETMNREAHYDFRPVRTFLVLVDENGEASVVDYYIIRDWYSFTVKNEDHPLGEQRVLIDHILCIVFVRTITFILFFAFLKLTIYPFQECESLITSDIRG